MLLCLLLVLDLGDLQPHVALVGERLLAVFDLVAGQIQFLAQRILPHQGDRARHFDFPARPFAQLKHARGVGGLRGDAR